MSPSRRFGAGNYRATANREVIKISCPPPWHFHHPGYHHIIRPSPCRTSYCHYSPPICIIIISYPCSHAGRHATYYSRYLSVSPYYTPAAMPTIMALLDTHPYHNFIPSQQCRPSYHYAIPIHITILYPCSLADHHITTRYPSASP